MIYPIQFSAAETKKVGKRSLWLSPSNDHLHFIVTPSTLNGSETSWIVSNDGKYAISSGANIVLWDIALGMPLIVYPGASGVVRFSEFSPNFIYVHEIDDNWSLRDFYTGEIKGFFKTKDIPEKSEAKLPDSFIKKVCSEDFFLDFCDMDVDRDGKRIALAGFVPMFWDLLNAEPKYLDNRIQNEWYDAYLNKDAIYRSPRCQSTLCHEQYWNVRCSFASDGSVYFSIPYNNIYLFDRDGVYKKKIECEQLVTQLRRFQDNIVVERNGWVPALLRKNDDKLTPIRSRKGNSLPFSTISDISEDGYFLGVLSNSDTKFTIGRLRSDGTAYWSPLEPFSGSKKSEINRLYLSNSGNRFSFTRNYENSILMHKLYVDSANLDNTSVTTHCCDFARGLTAYSGAFLNDSTFIAGTRYGEAFIGKGNEHKVVNETSMMDPLLNHEGAVIGIAPIDDSKFATADSYGTIRIFDSSSFELLMTMLFFPKSSDYIIYTPDNYYKATKGVVDKISYAKGLHAFSFRQFDLKYNRPDIILQRLGGDKDKISILHSAWKKRLKRMGFNESTIASAESHAPELTISNRNELQTTTDKGSTVIDVMASDDKVNLQSLHVLINDVPLYGMNGKKIQKTNRYSESIEIPLAEGKNQISIYCMNTNGQESLHHQISVENLAEASKRTLYIAAVGVSEYDDVSRNLQFAVSDAESFTDALAKGNTKFDEVKTFILKNHEFDNSALAKLRLFFNQSNRDDVTVLYYAGHGLLDESLNYYLACAGTDFSNPAYDNSIRYEDFQEVLEQIPSLHRFCFIDACHSGEIDKDDLLAVNVIPLEEYGDLTFRTGGKQVISTLNREIANQYHSMFVDLSQNAGITLVASSNGDELSMESAALGGGLFTSILKQALTGKCDGNKDNEITSQELMNYVSRGVSEISSGRQNPQVKFHDFDKITVLK